MSMLQNTVVILAAGEGKRMKSPRAKPLFKVLGEPMLRWVLKSCKHADLSNICVVTGYHSEEVEAYLGERYTTVFQAERRGTGHAVMQAREYLKSHLDENGGNTLILYGDVPFMTESVILGALTAHTVEENAVTVVTAEVGAPFGYGRIIRDEGSITAIVEERDATPEQREITEINSGVYWFNTVELLWALDELEQPQPDNAAGEYYLTDTIRLLLNKGLHAGTYTVESANSVLGANDQRELVRLNELARMAVIEKHMENGVEFPCTDGITIERDVTIGAGTTIFTGTIIKGKTIISEDCTIGPSCVIDDCIVGFDTVLNAVQAYSSTIGNNVKIGPFVHIRPDSIIKDGVKIGDFVEIKNSIIGENTAVAHLTYIGDSDVGKQVNFGCGCVTVNYDGIKKCRTTVGDNAFIGCQTKMIAPVKIGNGAYTAAGTTVTKDIPENALAIDRGELRIKEGYALRKLRGRRQ